MSKPVKAFLPLLLLAVAGPAQAHGGLGSAASLASGFAHPISGIDHVLAMLAVGFWAGAVGGSAMWIWPLTFLAVMAMGAIAALAGLYLPLVETGIAGSVLLLGLFIVFGSRMPVLAGAALCVLFASFHGYAHGMEMAAETGAIGYSLGFMAATALLNAAGVGLAAASTYLRPVASTPQAAGFALAAAGLILLLR